MLIRDAAALYQVQLEADGRSGHTRRQYQRHLELFAAWADAQGYTGEIGDLTHEDLARFLASAHARTRADGKPKRAASVNALRSSIRSFFAFAHVAGWSDSNPARLVRRALTGMAPPRGLSDAEEDRLLAVLDQAEGPAARRDAMLFKILLRVGIRIGSALALDLEDVDLAEGVLTIDTKGDRTERVFMPADIRDELASFLDGRIAGAVFAGRSGQRLTPRHVQRQFSAIRERAGLPSSVTPHSLRHTFGQRLLDRTGDLDLVRRALTHRSISSTQVYARCSDQRLREAVGA